MPPPAYGGADARQDRIEELENQLRDATAENERLQFELNQAQREVRRLNGIVGELAGVNQSLAEGQQTPQEEGAVSGGRSPAQAPAPIDPQAAATGQLGTLPASQLPGDSGESYRRAHALLVDGNYAEAEVAFSEFLESFPNAEQAGEARFWFAYTLLARNNYRDAAANFVNYLQNTPNGSRGPEAQVRLGMAFVGLAQDGTNDANDLRQACGAFSSLARRYPNAPANIRNLAAREARAANCPA
ncbi:MAG: outer membrane protein assembly factor BamD [Hyphomonadaceae bacterium]